MRLSGLVEEPAAAKSPYNKEDIMAQLWGGRFTKETDKLVYNFNASISFDQKFYKQDIRRKQSACQNACKAGNPDRRRERCRFLKDWMASLQDVESGKLEITSEYEDIHSFVEANLIDRIGDAWQEASHRKKPQRSGCPGHEALYHETRSKRSTHCSRELLEALQTIMEEQCAHLHAWLHTSSESTACYPGTPCGSIF